MLIALHVSHYTKELYYTSIILKTLDKTYTNNTATQCQCHLIYLMSTAMLPSSSTFSSYHQLCCHFKFNHNNLFYLSIVLLSYYHYRRHCHYCCRDINFISVYVKAPTRRFISNIGIRRKNKTRKNIVRDSKCKVASSSSKKGFTKFSMKPISPSIIMLTRIREMAGVLCASFGFKKILSINRHYY